MSHAHEFWQLVGTEIDEAVRRMRPFRAFVGEDSEGRVRLATTASPEPGVERHPRLAGPRLKNGTEVLVLPLDAKRFVVLGAVQRGEPEDSGGNGGGGGDNGGGGGNGDGESVHWDDVEGKPSEFPAEDHTHSASEVNSGQFGSVRLGNGAAINRVIGANAVSEDKLSSAVRDKLNDSGGGGGGSFHDLFPLNSSFTVGGTNLREAPNTSARIVGQSVSGTQVHDTGIRTTQGGFTWAYLWVNNLNWCWTINTVFG